MSRRIFMLPLVALVVSGCTLTNTAEATRHFPRDQGDVFAAAHAAAKEQARWDEMQACPVRGALVYECRSSLFGFVDDFKVDIDPDPKGGTLVHLDSRSRTGKSDWGVNAARIARFLDLVGARLAASPAEANTPATGVAGVRSQSR